MKNPVASHKKFLFAALTILLVSIFLHFLFSIRDYTEFQAYPYNDIFLEDSVAVNAAHHDSDAFALRFGTSKEPAKQEAQLVPVGITVGVRFYTDGIMVLGTDSFDDPDGKSQSPSDGKLQAGDILLKANDAIMYSHAQLSRTIISATDCVTLEILRDGDTISLDVQPAICGTDKHPKIGCWVRDSTQGIGTITYYDPITSRFGALGHGIMDVDTRKLMKVRHGQVMESHIIDVVKGKKGEPGELIGEIRSDAVIGAIDKNTKLGLYGDINRGYAGLPTAELAVARHDQIHQGPAKIFSNIEGGGIKSYDVYIESVNEDSGAEKGLVVRITDQGLITRTNGIVQGMSGSPIVQGDKIVGAITHVFVQNPLRGYGVFIEKMMHEEKAA
ncbi:MAG: SpoIVB peptidase [Clostridiales bacterium]|jgi:stage IV sporulation protein B|nr:SpoIVB peptidase [Clostridiales bacterium]